MTVAYMEELESCKLKKGKLIGASKLHGEVILAKGNKKLNSDIIKKVRFETCGEDIFSIFVGYD